MQNWWIFRGQGTPHDGIRALPPPPNWRAFDSALGNGESPDASLAIEGDIEVERRLGQTARGAQFQASEEVIDLVNAALYLRRPLFVTGKPGSGKSSLAFAVAHELKLGRVLHWMITTRVSLQDGLYTYDAVGRLQDASLARHGAPGVPDIGSYIRLGPLGTALLPSRYPRVLLIDEIDKGDIDLPNDLLNIFEEGEYVIPELARLPAESEVRVTPYDGTQSKDRVLVRGGRVRCTNFPFIVLTSNNEREFPPAFLRRCIRLSMPEPTEEKLAHIVEAHLGTAVSHDAERLIRDFISRRAQGDLATDQLLNAVYLAAQPGVDLIAKSALYDALLRHLGGAEG